MEDTPFAILESDRFRRRMEVTIGRELWRDRLKPDVELMLTHNPHRFHELGFGELFAIKLVTGHTIFYRIDFNHAEVTLEDIFAGES